MRTGIVAISRTHFLVRAVGGAFLAALLLASGTAEADTCTQTAIRQPAPLLGHQGEVFQLSDGSWWRIAASRARLSAYHPMVWMCDSPERMIVEGKTLTVQPLSATPKGQSAEAAAVIESRIAGQFNGWDGHTVFLLENGQVWQQASYSYRYGFAVRPRVLISPQADQLKMEVEGISEAIYVKRVK